MAASKGEFDVIVRELIIGTLVLFSVVPFITGQSCSITCEQITDSACQGLSYTTTGFPNFFGHTSQSQTSTYSSYIGTLELTGCYDQTKEFLCGALVPQCVENSGLIYPTSSTCEAFSSGCRNQLALVPGFTIDCNAFPESSRAKCYTMSAPTLPALPDVSVATTKSMTVNTTDTSINTTTACSIPCEAITIPQCESQSYSRTGFPNILNQTSISAVNENAYYVDVADSVNCYPQSREFLCGALLPECIPNEGLILPSKTMCQGFLDGCKDQIDGVAPGAVDFIDCNIFPDSDNPPPVCYAQPTVTTTEKPTTMTTTKSTVAATLGTSTNFNLHSVLLLVMACVILQQLA